MGPIIGPKSDLDLLLVTDKHNEKYITNITTGSISHHHNNTYHDMEFLVKSLEHISHADFHRGLCSVDHSDWDLRTSVKQATDYVVHCDIVHSVHDRVPRQPKPCIHTPETALTTAEYIGKFYILGFTLLFL